MYTLALQDTQRLIINVKYVVAHAKLAKKLQLPAHHALMAMHLTVSIKNVHKNNHALKVSIVLILDNANIYVRLEPII